MKIKRVVARLKDTAALKRKFVKDLKKGDRYRTLTGVDVTVTEDARHYRPGYVKWKTTQQGEQTADENDTREVIARVKQTAASPMPDWTAWLSPSDKAKVKALLEKMEGHKLSPAEDKAYGDLYKKAKKLGYKPRL